LQRARAYLLPILSGLLLVLSFPGFNFYLLEWFFLVPLLWTLQKATLKQSFISGTLMGMTLAGGGFWWMFNLGGIVLNTTGMINLIFPLAYSLTIAPLFGLIALVFQFLRRESRISELLLLPVVTVALFSIYPMLFYFKLGDSQSYWLTAVQAVDITGVYGLDFLIVLVNILFFKLLTSPKELWGKPMPIIALLLITVWFGYGYFSLASWDQKIEGWESKRIGIVQPNRSATLSPSKIEAGYSRLYPLEMEMSQTLAKEGVDVIIWPEGNFFGYSYWKSVRLAFKQLVREMKTPLVFLDSTKKVINGTSHFYNSSLWIDQQGDLRGQYNKMQLVPFGEYTPLIGDFEPLKELLGDFLSGLSPGQSHQSFNVNGMKLTPKICFESIFPQLVAASIADQPAGRVLVVQSQDGWYGRSSASEQHMVSSTLRAIENRVPLIHVLNNGSSAIVLPNGRYVFRSPFYQTGQWAVSMPFDPKSGGSFFSQHPQLVMNGTRLFLFLFLGFRFFSLWFRKQEQTA